MNTQFTLENNIFYQSIILTLTALILLAMSNFSALAEENKLQRIASESTWQFVNKHPQHLTKHGNITWGNDFLIRVYKDCTMNFGALYMSYNNEKLMSARDTQIDMRLDMVMRQEKLNLVDKVDIGHVFRPKSVGGVFSVAYLDFGEYGHVNKLLALKEAGVIGFEVKAPNEQIFDVNHDNWDFNGLEKAVKEASTWCSSKMNSNL